MVEDDADVPGPEDDDDGDKEAGEADGKVHSFGMAVSAADLGVG